MNSLIGIDYGTKKTGLAYSVGSFCFSYKTVRTVEVIPEILAFIEQKKPEKIILWMPYHIDGTLSAHSKKVQKFAKILSEHTTIKIILHDERLTTSEARISFSESWFNGDIDAESARLILEDYIEHFSE